MSEKITSEIKRQLINEHLKTPAGRAKLAKSMQQPLRSRRDYSAVARKTFLVEQLPDGALPLYDKDPDVAAYVIGEEGANIISMAKSRRVIFPLFEIASNPVVSLTEVKQRRFDVIDRMQDLAYAQVQAAEDERGFAIIDAVAENGFDSLGVINPDIPVAAPISQNVFADAFAQIEEHDLRVARVFMNARDFSDIRKFGREILDPESQQQLLRTGLMGTLWGAQIITSRLVPRGTVYCTCEPEFFGRMPVRTELTVLSADSPSDRTIGFSVFQHLGIGAFNPRGISRMRVAR